VANPEKIRVVIVDDITETRENIRRMLQFDPKIEIIGEAAKNLPEEVTTKYPEVPWKEMYYLRNKVSHEYFGIDYEVIWDISKNHLPINKIQIEHILETEK